MKTTMNNESPSELDLEIEAVQVSVYCNIIKDIIVAHKSLSIIKIASFSFIIKQRQKYTMRIFTAHNKTDLVLKFLSQAQGLFDDFCNQFPYILQAIDILVNANICEVHNGELLYIGSHKCSYTKFDSFTESALQESQNYTDRQFLREMIRIV